MLLLFFIAIGISYAYWKITMVQNNSNLVTSDCFSLEFTDENDINLENAYPLDGEELADFVFKTTPYHFTITNKCDREIDYTINLESLLLENGVKKLPDKYIDILLFDGNSSFAEFYKALLSAETEEEILLLYENFFIRPTILDMQKYGASFSINLSNLDINEEKVLPNAETAYIMTEERIGANESKSYNLLLLMNYDTPAMEETMNAKWEGKVTVTSTYGQKFKKFNIIQPLCTGGTVATHNTECGGEFNNSFHLYSELITKIVIQDTIEPIENASIVLDESLFKKDTIKSYLVPNNDNINDESTFNEATLYLQADGKIILPPDSSFLFANMPNLKTIEGIENLDTSQVVNMNGMFANDASLQELDLSHFVTDNVKTMAYTFYGLASITNLDISKLNTSNVTNMDGLFGNMSSVQKLDLSTLDTSNVTTMAFMLSGLRCMSTIDLTHINTNNVQNMSYMFSYSNFTSLDLKTFNTSNVTNMEGMFEGASTVATLDLSNFDTSNVTSMDSMFYRSGFKELNLSSFDTTSVYNFSHMFYDTDNLTNIIYGQNFVKDGNGKKVEITCIFDGCPANRPTDPSWNF